MAVLKYKDGDGNYQEIVGINVQCEPDNEDLHYNSSNQLQFKDRPNTSGMGKVILRKNMVSGVNTLTQSMIQATNTIYVIQYDFTLGEDITIPANCVLVFEGGSIANASGNNYTIKGHFSIKDCHHQIFKDVNFEADETYLGVDFIRPEWFGAKGDYDYATGIGTDDSVAISQAIRNANFAKVNKVKLSALTYYVANQINITSGDVLIEGVYATEREEDTFDTGNDVTAERNSCLITNQNIAILSANSTVTHPIHLKYINFKSTNSHTGRGFVFSSTFTGPTWPVIIEGCRFVNFNYAIHVSSTLDYCLHILEVKDCAFWDNSYCLYFDDTPMTSNLYFHDNQCHQNAQVIKAQIRNGRADIYNNNFENNDPGVGYVNKITVKAESIIEYHSNYHEGNYGYLLHIVSDSNVNKGIKIYDNTIISPQEKGYVYIENGDFTLDCKPDIPTITNGVIRCEKLWDNLYVQNGGTIAFNDFEVNKKDNTFIGSSVFTSRHSSINSFIDTILMAKSAVSRFTTIPIQSNTPIFSVMLVDMGNNYITSNLNVANITDNTTKQVDLTRISPYRYSLGLATYETTASTFICFVTADGTPKKSVFFASALKSNQFTKVLDLIKHDDFNNVVNSSNIAAITDMQIGDSCFVADTGKTITWNGTAWVDATGTPV